MIEGPIAPLVGPIVGDLIGPLHPRPDKKAVALRVGFHRNIEHFAQSLALLGMSLAWNTLCVTQYVTTCVTKFQIIFFSVLHEPPFNPRSQAFIEKIKGFEGQIPVLGEQLKKLDDKIWYAHALRNDLTELKKLFDDVTKTRMQVESYLETMTTCTSPQHPMSIRLTALKEQYDVLHKELHAYLKEQAPSITYQFEQILNIFVEVNADVPENMLKDLKEIDLIIKSVFRGYLSKDFSGNVHEKLHHLQDFDPQAQVQEEKVKPLKLSNYRNSCYMASVMQSLLCLDEIGQQFKKPLERAKFKTEEEYKKKLAIQKEICKFIEAKSIENKVQPRSHLEYFLYAFSLGERNLDQNVAPSVRRLRETIFNAELQPELKGRRNLEQQLDAASAMEFFTEEFLKEYTRVTYREHTKVNKFPDLEFVGTAQELNVIQVPFSKKKNGTVFGRLSNLVHNYWCKKPQTNEGRLFNPMKGIAVDQDKEAMTWAKLLELPEGKDFSTEQKEELFKLADALEESKYRRDPLKIDELFDELQNKREDWTKVFTDLAKACHLLKEDEEPDDLKPTFTDLCQKIIASFHILKENDEFTQWTRLESLPNVLILHFKRFDTQLNEKGVAVGVKINSPIEFPGIERLDPKNKIEPDTAELGILNLARYYYHDDVPKEQKMDARYEIVSYVVHLGSYNGGHYITFTKETNDEGKDIYWRCDDIAGNKQITRDEFFKQQDAYMIVCKRLLPKGAPA